MNFNVCYTSCACNQTPTAADWGKNKLICYGSCNSVRIYDPSWGGGGKVIKTLCGHTKRVNSTKWISGIDYETEIISGSADGTAIVWSYKNEDYVPFVLKGHDGIVNIVDGLYRGEGKKDTVVITASIDCTVRVWKRNDINDDFIQAQSINFGYGICMGFKMAFLPNSKVLLLACGTDDSKIRLYVENTKENEDCEFLKSEVLTGHENWVRGLDFTIDSKGDLILATCSQDALIRLWRIAPVQRENKPTPESIKYDLILRRSKIKTKDVDYLVSLFSILAGHEGWIYSVCWNHKNFTLLSSSLDKSMIIWEFSEESRLWLEKVRVGEVGGNVLGFYGGMFGPTGTSILGHGYHGAFHIWNYSEETNIWEPAVTVGGHFNEVVDLAWEPKGEFLVSVSTDQTTRIHAPWIGGGENNRTTWHEIARPQVHGYDMSCLAMLSRYQFASGAEEKIIRTFSAPNNFIDNFKRICKVNNKDDDDHYKGPKGASVPSLGLSNKAVFENDNTDRAIAKNNKEPYPEESHFQAIELTEPPTEETLMQNTLWPEIQKLYGHGYEVYSLAATPDGRLLASACKSTTTEHAAILLWDTSSWKLIQKLPSHNLTVAQLAFSPDSKYLLSVSRDRRWTLFSRNIETNSFQISATTDKKTGIHTRIIWCCAWSHDSKYFATGSRDGKVVIWTKNLEKQAEGVLGQCESVGQHLELKGESVTALAFAPIKISEYYLVAVGLESGIIQLYQWTPQEWTLNLTFENNVAHHLTVKRLAFRPSLGQAGGNGDDDNILQLASCGSDEAVRVYNINLK